MSTNKYNNAMQEDKTRMNQEIVLFQQENKGKIVKHSLKPN